MTSFKVKLWLYGWWWSVTKMRQSLLLSLKGYNKPWAYLIDLRFHQYQYCFSTCFKIDLNHLLNWNIYIMFTYPWRIGWCACYRQNYLNGHMALDQNNIFGKGFSEEAWQENFLSWFSSGVSIIEYFCPLSLLYERKKWFHEWYCIIFLQHI